MIRQNLYVSLGVIALLVLATTTGYFGIGPAVLFHEGSTLVVIANAIRLLGYRGPSPGTGRTPERSGSAALPSAGELTRMDRWSARMVRWRTHFCEEEARLHVREE